MFELSLLERIVNLSPQLVAIIVVQSSTECCLQISEFRNWGQALRWKERFTWVKSDRVSHLLASFPLRKSTSRLTTTIHWFHSQVILSIVFYPYPLEKIYLITYPLLNIHIYVYLFTYLYTYIHLYKSFMSYRLISRRLS